MPRRAQLLAYLGCSVSIGVFNAFNNFTLPLWLSSFTTSYVLISLLGNSKSLEGAIVSPLTGLWSDRTWLGWLGRRRPFILGGGLAAAVLLAFTPTITRLGFAGASEGAGTLARLAPMVIAIFLFTLAFNMADDLQKALLADITEGAERTRLSSLAVVADIGGQVGILFLGFLVWREGVPDAAFGLVGALVAVGVLVTTFGVREPRPRVWEAVRPLATTEPSPRHVGSVAAFAGRYRGAFAFGLVTFCYWSGVNAVLPLVSIYVRDILGASVGEAQLLPALLLLSTTLMAVPTGMLGNRFGKRRVLAAGYTIMAMAAVAALVITTREQGAVVFLLAGIGNSASIVLAIPLLADLVPRHRMGVAAGLLAASGSVAAPLASVLAGGLSQVYGPRVIFAVMAVMVLMALTLLPLVSNTPRAGRRVREAPLPLDASH